MKPIKENKVIIEKFKKSEIPIVIIGKSHNRMFIVPMFYFKNKTKF
jgi:hypothetical protein